MGKGFNLAETFGEALKNVPNSGTGPERIEYIELDKLHDDPNNFYSVDGLEDLAANIELIGLQQPIRVRPDPERAGECIIVSGHRRAAAIRKLVEDGREDLATVPCIVESGNVSPAMQELRLIYANAGTRRMTSADISQQAARVEALLYQLKEEGVEFPGRMRDHVAEACKVSKSKLARLKVIRDDLIKAAPIQEAWRKGDLGENPAYELARLPQGLQEEIVTALMEGKSFEHYGFRGLYANCITGVSEELDRLAGLICPKDKKPCADCAVSKRGRIIKDRIRASWGYINCSRECCEQCVNFLSCQSVCPRLKDLQSKRKADKKAEQKAADDAGKAAAASKVEVIRGIWARFGAARDKAGLSPAEYRAKMSVYLSMSDSEFEEFEKGEKLKADTSLPFGYSVRLGDARVLIDAADLLGVSIDWLLRGERDDAQKLKEAPVFKWNPVGGYTPQRVPLLTRTPTNIGNQYRVAQWDGVNWCDPNNSLKVFTGLRPSEWLPIPRAGGVCRADDSTSVAAGSWIPAEMPPDHPCECVVEFDLGQGHLDKILCRWDGETWRWRGDSHLVDMPAIRWCEVPCAAPAPPAPDASAWVGVEDRLPAPGVNVLVLDSDGDVDLDRIDRNTGKFFYGDTPGARYHATHWAPIPELPDGGEEAGDE